MESRIATQIKVTQMNTMLRVVLNLALTGLAGFCTLGFMATFEPLDADTQMTWRVIYGALFVGSLVGLIVVNRSRKDTRTDQEPPS